jgi:predicted SAM-dependent methyltransferase
MKSENTLIRNPLTTPPSLLDYLNQNPNKEIKLHLGCGGVRWRDFINVDLYPLDPTKKDSSRSGFVADAIADMRCLNLPEDSVDEIFTSHTVDHFTKWEAKKMFSNWKTVLRPGGKLVIEVADFHRCVLWLFHPLRRCRELARTQFYGNQWDEIDFETHRYVWSATEIRKVLKQEIGYSLVTISHNTETHHPGRDMRIEAFK